MAEGFHGECCPDREQLLGRLRSCWSVLDSKIIITFVNTGSQNQPAYDKNPLQGNSYDQAQIQTESKIKCYCVYQKPDEGNLDLDDNLTGGACDSFFPTNNSLDPHPWSKNCRKVKQACHPCRYASLDVTPGDLPAKPCYADPSEYTDTAFIALFGRALQANGVANPFRDGRAAQKNLRRIVQGVRDAERAHGQILNCSGKTDDPTVPGCWARPPGW